MLSSPYIRHPESEWKAITKQLVDDFPLSSEIIVSIVTSAWEDFFSTSFGNSGLKIGQDIFLPAQATGIILERLIAVNLANQDTRWRGGQTKQEKDIVCTFNERYCFEIKTSSTKAGLYGNRSTGHKSSNRQKHRTGYYLVINYKIPKEEDKSRKIWLIRFGWIDDEDWVGQKKPTGQQASVGANLSNLKLVTLADFR